MPSGGMLIIETANIELDDVYAAANPDVRPGSYVLISVADTGKGIDPKIVDRIFNPLFTTKSNGMGMGLAICRSIIEGHDGRLQVSASPEGGAVFQFVLPATVAR